MIQLAVFDMAGTTVEDGGGVYRALQDAVEETGVSVAAADLQTWMGAEKRAAISALITLGGSSPEGQVERVYARFQEILHEQYRAEPVTPITGTPEMIATLRERGIKVALTTGFSRDIAEFILGELGWCVGEPDPAAAQPAVWVDALVCGDEVAQGRPAPFMIHQVMERTGVMNVREVLVAGDTVVDAEAGHNAGASVVVGVLTGKLDEADFVDTGATHVLASVAEIPQLLEHSGSSV